MKLRLIIFKCFSVKNTTIHDLDNIFTKNVKTVTQYVNGRTNINLVTVIKGITGLNKIKKKLIAKSSYIQMLRILIKLTIAFRYIVGIMVTQLTFHSSI